MNLNKLISLSIKELANLNNFGKFRENGFSNRHNSRYWCGGNPQVIRARNNFYGYCALWNDSVVYLHFYEENLNGTFFVYYQDSFIVGNS